VAQGVFYLRKVIQAVIAEVITAGGGIVEKFPAQAATWGIYDVYKRA
jgi:hypothetical protein